MIVVAKWHRIRVEINRFLRLNMLPSVSGDINRRYREVIKCKKTARKFSVTDATEEVSDWSFVRITLEEICTNSYMTNTLLLRTNLK